MPELPEVETIRRQLDDRIVGTTLTDAWAFESGKFADAIDAIGAAIIGVSRRGKYLIVELDDDRELVLHLGMTGSIEILDATRTEIAGRLQDDANTPWIRAWWQLDDGRVLVFHDMRRFGRIALVATGQYQRLPTLHAMGPEPLDSNFTPRRLHRSLKSSTRAVKTQLLGQRVVAGVGNIYADEALWRAGINPASTNVGLQRATRLHQAIVDVLGEAITHGGTRIRDCKSLDGATGQHQYHLDCYGHGGDPCPRCAAVLRHRFLDARGTTWCPVCQRR